MQIRLSLMRLRRSSHNFLACAKKLRRTTLTTHRARRLGTAVLVASVIPTAALAATYTGADLVGDYAFSAQTPIDMVELHNSLQTIGRLHFDGAGNVDGRRIVLRLAQCPTSGRTQYARVEQTFTGSYTVDPDGIGTMTISTLPELPGYSLSCTERITFDDAETYDFVLYEAGASITFMAVSFIWQGAPAVLLSRQPLIGGARRQDVIGARISLDPGRQVVLGQ